MSKKKLNCWCLNIIYPNDWNKIEALEDIFFYLSNYPLVKKFSFVYFPLYI